MRTAAIWVLRISVSAALLYWLLTRMVDVHQVWRITRSASVPWLGVALTMYLLVVLVSSARWDLLLKAQHVDAAFLDLFKSFLVATFFGNFLPSNIGGDVIRIADTAPAAGSKTLATTVVLLDRGIGLLGLTFVAAVGATVTAEMSTAVGPVGPGVLWAGLAAAIVLASPFVLAPNRVGQLLRPLRALHQEWVEERIARFTTALSKFKAAPRALAGCFIGAIVVQGVLVAFYAAIAHALHMPVPLMHLAILVPLSFVVQMLPVSVNGFGVREMTFRVYFVHIGLRPEAGVALSFVGWAMMALFSVSGALTYMGRRRGVQAVTAT